MSTTRSQSRSLRTTTAEPPASNGAKAEASTAKAKADTDTAGAKKETVDMSDEKARVEAATRHLDQSQLSFWAAFIGDKLDLERREEFVRRLQTGPPPSATASAPPPLDPKGKRRAE